MQQLSSAQILDIWELSSGETDQHFAINIICEAYPEIDRCDALALPIGARDTLLLQSRCTIFGTFFENVAECPECHKMIEWQLDLNDIKLPESIQINEDKRYSFTQKGYEAKYRLLNTNDILSIDSLNDLDKQSMSLLSDCLDELKYKGKSIQVNELPATIRDSISEELEKQDRLADIEIALSCSHCNYNWITTFDIISYLWIEIDALAQRLLYEIGVLASHLGWSEEQILRLSSKRRANYLAMLG